MVAHYSRLSISLGVTELRNTYTLKNPVHKIHLRSFEIPMSGGIQLVSYSPEMAEYYTQHEDILFYNSTEEMVSLAKFYLKGSSATKRKKMKLKARERSVRQHCWIHRFNAVFKELGIHD